MRSARKLLPLLLLVAALTLCGLHACAEAEIVPGMLMTAGETFYDEEFDDAERGRFHVPEGIVPGSEAWREGGQRRASVTCIQFLDSLADAPEDAWDMSALGDRSVLGWRSFSGQNDDTTIYIAAEGGVKANPDSSYLFAGYCSAAQPVIIEFNGNFDVSTAVDMTGMFQDTAFESCDIAGWDTSGVTCMRNMFWNCGESVSPDLSSFETSKVTDMSGMFRDCGMESIDLSGFTMESLEHSEGMFAGCEYLAALRLNEAFDLDALAPDAFEGCGDFEIARAGGVPEE